MKMRIVITNDDGTVASDVSGDLDERGYWTSDVTGARMVLVNVDQAALEDCARCGQPLEPNAHTNVVLRHLTCPESN